MIVHARPSPVPGVVAALLVGLAVALALVLADCGNVDEVHADDETPALALARACSGETAWTALDECTAIGEVLAGRSSTGEVTAEIARAYSAALRTRRRPWVAGLGPDGARPAGWPAHLDWARWRPRWLALLDHARLVVAGEAPSPCEERPDHFGGPMDDGRALRAGWRLVDCGSTRNRFWATR